MMINEYYYGDGMEHKKKGQCDKLCIIAVYWAASFILENSDYWDWSRLVTIFYIKN